ncbi:MAG: glycosyltransferase family 39 protein [Ignavibacteriales bacterium]|nr:glycosyltransferase family 39 protein [Ignavibacteriales bacterium]
MSKQKKRPEPAKANRTITVHRWNRNTFLLIAVMTLGLLIRLLYFFENIDNPFFQMPASDGKIYCDWASAIFSGNNSNDVFFMSPVYPYFLSSIFLLTGIALNPVYIIQIVISISTILFVYLSGKKLFSEYSGLLAALLFALCGPSVFYTQLILSETLQMFIISILVFEMAVINNNTLYNRWLFVGVITGFGILIRPTIAVVVLAAIIIIYFRLKAKGRQLFSVKASLLFIIGLVLVIIPVSTYNFLKSGQLTLFTANSGINLWIGNNQSAPGVFKTPEEFAFKDDITGKTYAEAQTGHKLTLNEADDFWVEKTLREIMSNPGAAFYRFGKKILVFFSASENPQSTYMDIGFAKQFSPISLSLSFTGFFSCLLLAAVGLYYSRNQHNILSIFSVIIIFYALATSLFFITGRFRMGLIPILCIPAGYGILRIVETLKDKNWRALGFAVISPLMLILMDVLVTPQFTYHQDDVFLQIAEKQFAAGSYDSALKNFETAATMRSTPEALMGMANVLSIRGETDKAEKLFQQVIGLSPQNYMAYFNIGLFSAQRQKFDLAEKYFLKAKELNKEFYETDRNLAVLYHLKEDYRNALLKYTEYLPHAANEQVRAAILEDIQRIKSMVK